MSIVYRPPSTADLDAIATSFEITGDMESAAEAGREHAESIAPVDTGTYRSKFRVDVIDGEARLVNDDEGAAAIEFGSPTTSAHHTLSQTADRIEGGA